MIIKKIVNGDKVFIENFYKNLLKMIIMNIIFFYVPLRLFISIRVLLVWFIWGFTLMLFVLLKLDSTRLER